MFRRAQSLRSLLLPFLSSLSDTRSGTWTWTKEERNLMASGSQAPVVWLP